MYAFHSFANIFPMMSETEFQSLVQDIKAFGLRDKIVLYQGLILDGRNRYRACQEADIAPQFREFTGDEESALNAVISWNLERRHLSLEQKAAVALELKPRFEAIAKEKQRQAAEATNRKRKEGKTLGANLHQAYKEEPEPTRAPKSAALAAKSVGVSERAVFQAQSAVDRAPELLEPMKQGKINVSQADELSRLPESARQDIIAAVEEAAPGTDSKKLIREKLKPHVTNNSGNNEWYTPAEFVEAARSVLGTIDLDPASCEVANEVVQATKFYSIEDDGLVQPWEGKIWLNPPYGSELIGQFISRLVVEYVSGDVDEAIILVNNATETEWFQELGANANAICLVRKRIKYWNPDRETNSPLQGQAILYLGQNAEAFEQQFKHLGLVFLNPSAFWEEA